MPVISLISQKGGVGKSTLTMMLLNALQHHYQYKVALIDADFPQNSIYKKRQRELKIIAQDNRLQKVYDNIYQGKAPYSIIKSNLSDAPSEIKRLKESYDFVFVDIAGTVNQQGIIDFLKEINYFFIPIFQDDLSLISSMELYRILYMKIQPMSTAYRDCKIVFNRVPAKNHISKIRSQLTGKVDFLEEVVSAHAVYERAYRSTLFPMPTNRKESDKFFRFVDCFLKTFSEIPAVVEEPTISKTQVIGAN